MKKIFFIKNLIKIKKNKFSSDLQTKFIFFKGDSHLKIFQKILLTSATLGSINLLFEFNKEYLSFLEKNLLLSFIVGTSVAFHYSTYKTKKIIKLFKIHNNKKNFYFETFSGILKEEQKIHFNIKELKEFKIDRVHNLGFLKLSQGEFSIEFDENEFEDLNYQKSIENCLQGNIYDEELIKKKIKKYKK